MDKVNTEANLSAQTTDISIELSNPSGSYFPGDCVDGRVVIQNGKEEIVSDIAILLRGRGEVKWTEPDSNKPYNKPTVTSGQFDKYVDKEDYVSLNISATLPAGATTYPFSFILPSTLPSSFSSSNARIQYFLEVEITSSNSKSTSPLNCRITRLPFTVIGILDLNLHAGAIPSEEYISVKRVDYFVCRDGELGFVVRLPQRSCFVPGEVIVAHAEILNRSARKVSSVTASLQQIIKLDPNGSVPKVIRKVLTEVAITDIGKGEYELWTPVLDVPPVPPTLLGGNCELFEVRYVVHFVVQVSGLRKTLTGEIPIMIGNIPLRSTFAEFRSNPGSGTLLEKAAEDQANAIRPDSQIWSSSSMNKPLLMKTEYPDLPPFLLEDAVSVEPFNYNLENKEECSDYCGEKPLMSQFVPKYITYQRKL